MIKFTKKILQRR